MLRSAARAAAAVAGGEVSPVELATAALREVEAWQPVTNAFTQVRPEETLEEARRLADRLASGAEPGPLAGVPLAVKDLFDVAGWETTGCCAAYRGRVTDRDAPAVARLRASGALVIGKTNQHELAAGASNLVSSFGPTRNPWDPARLTGGSSGGSAAAVASGCAPLALGTDTGGSVRIPASFCGLTGLKTTHGSLPLEGVMPLAPSLDTVGPITAGAEDARLAFEVLLGTEVRPTMSATEMRVSVVTGDLARTATPDVLHAIDGVAGWLGPRARHPDPGVLEAYRPDDWEVLGWRELYEAHGDLLRKPELLGEPTRRLLERGRDTTAAEIEAASGRVAGFRERLLSALAEVDALLLPATPFPAPRLDFLEVRVDRRTLDARRGAISVLTRPVNLAGVPAAAFPIGFSGEGLPLGAQVVGRPDSEADLLGLVAAWQLESDFHLRTPERREDEA